jgi:hypothetical protein
MVEYDIFLPVRSRYAARVFENKQLAIGNWQLARRPVVGI